MQKRTEFTQTLFSEAVIRQAVKVFREQFSLEATHANPKLMVQVAQELGLSTESAEELGLTANGPKERTTFMLGTDGKTWTYEFEEEFFADYRGKGRCDQIMFDVFRGDGRLLLHGSGSFIGVTVTGPTRQQIEAVSAVFESNAEACRMHPPRPTIFIGHGRSPLWRDLKDHLHEKHGFEIAAYEIGARAGHAVRDILEEMLGRSAFALLVLTAEDETADGKLRARQNVVHEAGLFQGRLGFRRAIVLLEQDTEEFSNIHGLEQIRFAKGNIKETFGEVLATLRREFGKV